MKSLAKSEELYKLSSEVLDELGSSLKSLDDIAPKYADDVMDYRYAEGSYEPYNPNVWEMDKYDDIAENLYNQIRNMTDDVDKIASNTGWDIADIQKIKKWLFDTEVFNNGKFSLFPSDYEQAIAWERLMNGNYYDIDILLLRHELYELTYYTAVHPITGCTQDSIHRITDNFFNWLQSLRDLGYGG